MCLSWFYLYILHYFLDSHDCFSIPIVLCNSSTRWLLMFISNTVHMGFSQLSSVSTTPVK